MSKLRTKAQQRDRVFNVYLMVPYMSWEGVHAVHEQDAIAICEGRVVIWPDLADGPMDFLVLEVEAEKARDDGDDGGDGDDGDGSSDNDG